MAVLKMKRIDIYALKKNRKRILERLQAKGAVEVRVIKNEDTLFSQSDTSSAIQRFEKNAKAAADAVAVMDELVPPEKALPPMFAGRIPVQEAEFYRLEETALDKTKIASRVLLLDKKISELKADIVRYSTQMDALKPWQNLDIPMRTLGTDRSNVFIGSLPEEITREELLKRLAEAMPDMTDFDVEVIWTSPQQTCLFIVCHARTGVRLENTLRAMGFSYPPSPSKRPPAEQIELLGERVRQAERQIDEASTEIKGLAEERKNLMYIADYYRARAEKYRVLGELWQSRHTFVLSGYIPEKSGDAIQSFLENSFGAFVELSDPEPEDDVPVILENNAYSAPVENVIAGYSYPGRTDPDPSNVMALFYYVLFGMMLSDAAYGLLITVGSAVILKKCRNMEPGTRQTFKMFLYSGISTMFWGVMFGSFFGDAIAVISSTFFGRTIEFKPLWFAPLDDPMKLLMFSLLLGIIHLFAGLFMLMYKNIKQKQYLDALYDSVFWLVVVGGLIITLLSTDMFVDMANISFKIPPLVRNIALICVGISAIGIIATAGRESKSPIKRLLKGIYGIYNITGYLSDILSYSRLLALGLATGIIASVFNMIGSMMGGGILGAIFFIFVFLVGHAMNIAINALGAYVHTNRLQYVEFFGKFYDGGGRSFEPFTGKTKHIKITEDK